MSNNPFTPYIREMSAPADITPVIPYRRALSGNELREDIEQLRLLLDTAYSGREYWELQGHSFVECYQRLEELSTLDRVLISDFYAEICHTFSFIHDGHLSFVSPGGQRYSFAKHLETWFSDVVVEADTDGFHVVESPCDALPLGTILRNIEPYLFETFGKRYYLGRRIWSGAEAQPMLKLEKIVLPLHLCRASEIRADHGVFSFERRQGIPVVSSSLFLEGDKAYLETIANDFEALGRSLRNEPIVIWDIHDNHGGNSDYPKRFLMGLNDCAEWPVDCAILSSPAIQQAQGKPCTPKRSWTLCQAQPRTGKGSYQGTLYLLTSAEVASSGEAAVSMAMSVPHCIRVGENTAGIGTFGDTLSYVLPHSHIRVIAPYKLFLSGAKEGEGYDPHIWLDEADLVGACIRMIRP